VARWPDPPHSKCSSITHLRLDYCSSASRVSTCQSVQTELRLWKRARGGASEGSGGWARGRTHLAVASGALSGRHERRRRSQGRHFRIVAEKEGRRLLEYWWAPCQAGSQRKRTASKLVLKDSLNVRSGRATVRSVRAAETPLGSAKRSVVIPLRYLWCLKTAIFAFPAFWGC
jgi:hypothetical protein